MSITNRRDAAAVALLFLILAVVFIDVCAGSGVFFFRDFTRYYVPEKKMIRDIVLAGEFPAWARPYSAGQPLAANPEHEIFYPLTWLILLPGWVAALHWQILLHLAIALAGMYAFLRSIALAEFPSFFGALTFGLGGVMLSCINLLPCFYCVVWLPLTCLFTRRFILHGANRDWGIASLFLGLQLLIGEPATGLQSIAVLVAYAGHRAYVERSHGPIVAVVKIGIAAAGLAAVQILPTLDFARDSARARPFAFATVSEWSMPWSRLLELFWPNVFGHLFIDQRSFYWGGSLYGAKASPFYASIYAGLSTAVLAVAAVAGRLKRSLPLAIWSGFFVIIGAGAHTPLLRALYEAGLASRLRYPEKFVFASTFAVTIMAAQALHAILSGDERVVRAARVTAGVVTIASVGVFLWSMTRSYAPQFARFFGVDGAFGAVAIQTSRFDLLVAAARASAVLILFAAARRARHAGWMAAAAAITVLDLARLAPEIAPRTTPEFFQRPSSAAVVDRDSRIFHDADWRASETDGRKWRASGRNYWVYRNGLFPMTGAAWGISTVLEPDVDLTSLLPTVDFVQASRTARAVAGDRALRTTMAMSNARYRAVYRPFDEREANGDPAQLQAIAFEETAQQPRYYFGWPVLPVRDAREFAAGLVAGDWPATTAFTSERVAVASRGVVHSAVETPNRATIDVEAPARAFLVMSVTPHRYWRTAVDGRAVTPVVTNIGYQGIVIEPGRHRVTMLYRNNVIAMGAAVSIAALIVTSLLAARMPR